MVSIAGPWAVTRAILSRPLPRQGKSGLEVVRVVRENLAAVVGDEHQVLEPAAAVAVAVEAGLDRDHVARNELPGGAAERRLLVHLEPDAVAERVVEAVLEHLAGLLREKGREAALLEDRGRDPVQLLARDPGFHGGDRAVECLLAELVVLEQLFRGLSDDERARHVRVAAGLAVAWEQIEADRLVRGDRARAH